FIYPAFLLLKFMRTLRKPGDDVESIKTIQNTSWWLNLMNISGTRRFKNVIENFLRNRKHPPTRHETLRISCAGAFKLI
ncbi:hypothetical protein L9F63_000741, partial [Diploptera punctata]